MVIKFYNVDLTTAGNDTTYEYTTEVSGSYGIEHLTCTTTQNSC